MATATQEPETTVTDAPNEATVADDRMSRAEMERRLEELSRQVAALSVNGAPVPLTEFGSSGFVKKPGRHYIPVEKAHVGTDGTTHLPYYMTLQSMTEPGKRMYTIETDDPLVTGNANVVLLSCSEADYLAMLHDSTVPARAYMVRPPVPDFKRGSRSQVTDEITKEEEFIDTEGVVSHLVK